MLAGHVGMVMVPPDMVASRRSNGKAKKTGSPAVPTAPNPLKGTALEKGLNERREAVRKAKEELGVTALPSNHPALLAYAEALKAYKAQKASLKPMGTTGVKTPAVKRKAPASSSSSSTSAEAEAKKKKKSKSNGAGIVSNVAAAFGLGNSKPSPTPKSIETME